MAFRGIDTARTLDYVSPKDPDKENPTRFKLRSPSKRVINYLRDRAIANEGAAEGNIELESPFGLMYEYVRFGLVGLVNFLDEKDQTVEFTTERVSVPGVGKMEVVAASVIDLFPEELLHEVAVQVMTLQKPTEEAAKNSDGSS